MINSIIRFSIKNKLVVLLAVMALVIWGIYSATRLPVDAVPDITNNQVQVITQSPSLSAPEVEQLITFPLEISFANIPGVTEIRSISRSGLSVITIVFSDETDTYLARQLVTEKISLAASRLPEGMGIPELAPVTTGLGEIYQYVLFPAPGYEEKFDAMELRTIQDWIVKRQLAGVKGVVEVSSFGGYQKQYEVSITPAVINAYDISIQDVFNALAANNANSGGSYIEKGRNVYFIRGEGMITGMDDIKKIVVKNIAGTPLTIGNIAEVRDGHAVRYGALTRNGQGEVAGGIVLMLKGANSAEVIDAVKERIEQIKNSLPEGVVLEAYLDRSELIDRTIHTVVTNLVEGGLIVIFVLILLLGSLRAGIIVASVIPLSMLFALGMMNVAGVSANLMSLGAIDFGLIVDGAVIIVEAVIFRLHSRFNNTVITRAQMEENVFEASSKIRKSAAFGEIIILIVYLPILALSGIEGKMFHPMAQTVSFAIAGALILSLTYVPMMCALFLNKNIKIRQEFSEKLMQKLYKLYEPLLLASLNRKALVLVISVIFFAFSLVVFRNLGGEFIPNLDEGDFAVETRLSAGTSLSQTIETSTRAENILLGFPEVKQVISKIGTAEIPTDPMPVEANDLMVILKDKSEWTSAATKEELADKMKEALEVIPGVIFEFQQPIQMRFNELMTGVKSDIAIKIYGEDLAVLTTLSRQSAALISKIRGVGDLKVEQITGLPQIRVKYNRDRIAQHGMSVNTLNMALRTAFAGEKAGVVIEGERRFDLVLRMDQSFRRDIQDVRELPVSTPAGIKIPLSELAQIDYDEAPVQISRDDTKRRITIGINARGRDVESLVDEMKQKLEEEVKLPEGYYFRYGGQFENLQHARQRLSLVVPLALLLIFVLLYFTFGSFSQSLLVFSAIPMAAIGGIFFLWLRNMPFSISAGVGFIALFGVAVLNGIVLISYFNQLRKEGVADVRERILRGVRVRFRPVLLTAAVASLGFLPMALSRSAGAEVQKPLATVVIGGLISATLLTLIILPVLYHIFAERSDHATDH